MGTNTQGRQGARRSIEGLEPRRLLSLGLVKNINPLTAAAAPSDLVEFGGPVYFAADAGADEGEVTLNRAAV